MTRDTDERGKLADQLESAYDKVKMYPENSDTGFMDLLALRNLVPQALAALRAPAGHAEREAILRIVESAKYKSPDAQDQHDWNAACEHIEEGIAALSNAPAPSEGVRLSDDKLAGWARNWHWKDCADDKHFDPSIYFRDQRLLKAFIAEFVDPVRPAPADTEDQGPDTLGERP